MSNILPVVVNFNIPVSSEDIGNFLIEVLASIDKYILLTNKIKSRIKLILTELSTNFIKHVSTSNGNIEIEIGNDSMLISKRYKENSFKRVIENKINIDKFGEVVEIYFSATNNHYIEVLHSNKLRFLNPFEMGFHTDALKDHFGLHILTVASDDFLYEYNPDTCEDCFTACIKYS